MATSITQYQKPDAAGPGENRTIWVIWLVYGAFYFCRTNISAAVPGLSEPTESGR